jgi:hypothetical protein
MHAHAKNAWVQTLSKVQAKLEFDKSIVDGFDVFYF